MTQACNATSVPPADVFIPVPSSYEEPAATPPASGACCCGSQSQPGMSAPVKWLANISALGGGAAMAGFPAICLSPWSYVPFFVSHVLWSVMAWRMREKELTYLNLGALGLDIWAIAARVL